MTLNLFKKANKKQSKLRLAIEGASGSGKTYAALILAKTLGEKIAVIDTEHGSASLYSDKFKKNNKKWEFDVIELSKNYSPESYINMINMAEDAKYDVLIIDSMSHEWNGPGGCLDITNKITIDSTSKNSYTAWAKVTPRHDKFINAILASPLHIITTMRSKTVYDTSKNQNGKMVIEKKGTAPIQRDSVEYEFTIVFDLNKNHLASVSKDRTGLFDGKDFMITEEIGETLLKWLNSGEKLEEKTIILSLEKKINECATVSELEFLYQSQKDQFTEPDTINDLINLCSKRKKEIKGE